MSFSPTRQPIEPFKLLNDAIGQVGPIYVPLLIIASVGIVFSVLQGIVPAAIAPVIAIVYGLIVTPILNGAAMSFCYRYLQQGTSDLKGAFDKAISQSGQLIIGTILYALAVVVGSIFLIVPGIYLSVRFGFVLYAIISENCSAIDGFKYSSKLVEGRWWPIFGSMLVSILFFIPIFIMAIIAGIMFASQPLLAGVAGGIIGAVVTPPMVLFYVKIYLRAQETA
jgi:hypothetical protein